MQPYLEENEIIASLIKTVGLLLYLGIILLPFLLVRLRRFHPTRLWHIIGAYIISFGIFLFVEYGIGKLDRWIYDNFINTHWLQDPISNTSLRGMLLLLLIYPVLIFYCTKLLHGKFTKKRFLVSLGVALLLFIALSAVAFLAFLYFLGQAFSNL